MTSRRFVPLWFRYLGRLYLKSILTILAGVSLAFAAIDYFQHMQKLDFSWNYKILYLFFRWEQALGLLYPLSIVLGVIVTKLSLIKSANMSILHALGFERRRLLYPFIAVATAIYLLFTGLESTSFTYAKDRAESLLRNEIGAYDVDDIFFKYNDTFVYMKKLDPVRKRMREVTIFKVSHYRVIYVMYAAEAKFDGEKWDAYDVQVRYHRYDDRGRLIRYETVYKDKIETLEGYKPKMIESLYEGKSMNILDAFNTWRLLRSQGIDTDKVRAVFYEKLILPLFSIALMIVLFVKIPYHRRLMQWGKTIGYALGATFGVWGVLFGLDQLSKNGVLTPETAILLPVGLLWIAALSFLFVKERIA